MKEGKSVFNWEVRNCPEPEENRHCGTNCDLSDDCALAMAYVPMQKWRKIYSSEIGFCRGTIFEELDKPFTGRNM